MNMGKTLDDLATDKPEDIAKELDERAKAKEESGKAPAEITDEPKKLDEPETPEGEAPAKGDAPKEPAPSETEETAELPPLLKRLKTEYGIDHSYKDEEALLKSHASLRKKLSGRDEDARLGRALREAGVSPEDISGLFKSRSEPAKGKDSKAPEWNPAWDREIEQVKDDEGKVELRGPPEMVREYRAYMAELDTFRREPIKALKKWGLEDLVEQAAEKVVMRRQGEEMFRAFMKDNGDFIEENRDEIDALIRDEGFTPLTAVKHLKLVKETEDIRKGKGTEDAKKADLDRLKGKVTRRAGAKDTPIKSVRELADMSTKDAILTKLGESGQSIPESW